MNLHITITERINKGQTVGYCTGCGSICYQVSDDTHSAWLLHGSIDDAIESGDTQKIIDDLRDINCGCGE